MKIIAPLVIGKWDVERAVGFDHAHHQALGIGLGSGLLLEYLSFLDHPQGLRSGNASLGGAHQGMVAPEDALRVCCSADCGKVKSHESKDIEVA
jgi:hypothetical protein